MKYHVFTNNYNSKGIANGDTCIYCHKSAYELYMSLSKSDKIIYYNSTSKDEATTFISLKLDCEFGISENEFLIKKLLE